MPDYFVVIIPSLVIAPLFFAGKAEFGTISQADLAFAQVLSALSLIVTQFADLTGFIAVINRLAIFTEALDGQGEALPVAPPQSTESFAPTTANEHNSSQEIKFATGDNLNLQEVTSATRNLRRVIYDV